MTDATYRIEDEPSPGPLAEWSVRPFWPLLAVMLGGVWLSWPWFVLNGVAVGSPNLKKEIGWAVGGVVVQIGLAVALLVAFERGLMPERAVPYALLVLVVWKLLVSYRLYQLQAGSFELYEYFGGTVKNGMLLVFVGLFFGPRLLGFIREQSVFWYLVLQ
jgi:hypothetical protein